MVLSGRVYIVAALPQGKELAVAQWMGPQPTAVPTELSRQIFGDIDRGQVLPSAGCISYLLHVM
jgi:hypothetical protein